MLHELKDIVKKAKLNQVLGVKSVLVTVVDLDGSSYRRPGVRMLISSNGEMFGAVSGGCVEKEIFRRAKSVFETGKSKIMTYDGRYRLGCEGVLYLLLEPFEVSDTFYKTFFDKLEERIPVSVLTYYEKIDNAEGCFYSEISFGKNLNFTFSKEYQDQLNDSNATKVFKQTLKPCFKLIIIGDGHDAVKLCELSAMLGWDIEIVSSVKNSKKLKDFPGASTLISTTPESYNADSLDLECAVVLMTHNYAQDLRYLLKLKNKNLPYIGVLGSAKRREQLQNDLFDYAEELDGSFLDTIYSPAGLNIGAITPEEIAVSILAEILATIRNKKPVSLKTISRKIYTQS